jgi:hypothetical protein
MRLSNRVIPLLLAVGMFLLPGGASACPFCDGGPSGTNEVKEAIFGEGFWFNLGAAASPFLVVLALVLAIHGVPTGRQFPASEHSLAEGAVNERTA